MAAPKQLPAAASRRQPLAAPDGRLPELKAAPGAPARPRTAPPGLAARRLRMRRRRWKWPMAVFLTVPTIVVFVYLQFFASSIYVSETQFAVRGQQPTQAASVAAAVLGGQAAGTVGESWIVYTYIHSLDMYSDLDSRLGLTEHYGQKTHDPWYRLKEQPMADDLRRYWEWAAETKYDPDTGILSVSVKAFSPEMAQKACQGVLENSERLVNRMNERAREDAMRLASEEVKRAEQRVMKAQEALRAFRDKASILDFKAEAEGLYGLVNRLEADVARTTAELSEARTYMSEDSPQTVAIKTKLDALTRQLAKEKLRLASTKAGDGRPLSSVAAEFQRLSTEEDFAQKQFASAMASLETARVQAESKSLYVESFARPALPDESLYPRPFLFTLIFFLALVCLAGIVSLVAAAVREHAGF